MTRRTDGRYIVPENWAPAVDGLLFGSAVVIFIWFLLLTLRYVAGL